jgi:mannose-6-phosphate isomerase-like protein (cupin superfamily)
MENLPHYERILRPWGSFERYTLNDLSTVKIITVDPNQEFSLQSHVNREEFWKILSGTGDVTIGSKIDSFFPGDTFFTEKGVLHRLQAGPEQVVFLEIAFGEFDESDITRVEDDYGRV